MTPRRRHPRTKKEKAQCKKVCARTQRVWAYAGIVGGEGTRSVVRAGCADTRKAAETQAKAFMPKDGRIRSYTPCAAAQEALTCKDAQKFARMAVNVCAIATFKHDKAAALKQQEKLVRATKGLKRTWFVGKR